MIYSHPNQSLEKHIRGLLKYADEILLKNINDEKLKKMIKISILFHDFGKGTKFFQNYILSDEKRKDKRNAHSLISAIVAFFVSKENNFNDFDSFLIFTVINNHHGNLNDLISETNKYSVNKEEYISLLEEQSNNYYYREWNQIEAKLSYKFQILDIMPEINSEILINWINIFFESLIKNKRNLRKHFKNNNSTNDYLTLNLIFSCLIDADKIQASLGNVDILKRYDLNSHSVDIFIQNNFKHQENKLNNLRNQAYKEVNNNIENAVGNKFAITLPTGLGKTLISFNTALKLRNLREKETGIKKRIIYSLPFLSVIEQNFDVFKKVLSETVEIVDSTILTKHHSLIDFEYQINFEEEKYEISNQQSEILIESWNAEIITTTFVQLFHTLLSNRNRALKKFNKFANSIIIIDEVQNIPVKYWELIRQLLIELTNNFNTDIILLTATQPEIFKKEEIINLCDSKKYFNQLNRITLNVDLHKKTINEFFDELVLDDDLSYLFIFNTISSAKEFYKKLIDEFDEPIAFLSTHKVPKERLKTIQEIKKKKYRIAVSTQLVEAGVDIDFNVVYRDLAPLDSIIQSAGRCNRNNSDNKGATNIIVLINESGKKYSSFIYENIKLDVTVSLLKNKEFYDEREILSLIENYYHLIKKRLNQEESTKLLKSILTLYYTGENNDRIPISDFRLIEKDYKKIDVFIELDKEAKELWKRKEEILMIDDRWEAKDEFLKIKRKFNEYVISISANSENLPPMIETFDMGYVSLNQLEDYYDYTTGYLTKGNTVIW